MFVSEKKVVLEPAARGWAEVTAAPPYLYEMEPAAARKVPGGRAGRAG